MTPVRMRIILTICAAVFLPACGALAAVEQEVSHEIRAEDAVDTRFQEQDGVITDTGTGLAWRIGPDTDTDWDSARLWAGNLDGGGWRMPHRQELLALVEAGLNWHDMGPFDMRGGSVWSDSTSRYGAHAWVWDFLTGAGSMVNTADTSLLRGFAVRESSR